MYLIIFLLIIFFICSVILSSENNKNNEKFEQVKINLKQNPLNQRDNSYDININNNNGGGCPPCDNTPDVVVPVYAPWRTYWTSNTFFPYYPFYPYYYNNYWS